MWTFIIFLLLIPSSILNGYAFSVLWGWFVVPVFSLVALSIPEAIGICLLITFATYKYERKDYVSEEDKMYGVVLIVVKPLISLGLGFVVTLFL